MVHGRTVLALLACALAANAQLLGEEDGGRYPDFPSTCASTCDAFESMAMSCSDASPGDTAFAEAAVVACMCTDAVGSAIEACGSCITSNTADMSTSESGATILQLAISFTRGCGRSLSIDGVDGSVSSVLADGGSEYSSWREDLSTAAAAQNTLVATSSDGAAQMGGASTSAASFTSSAGAQKTSMTGPASQTSGSSAASASASSSADAGSGAASLAAGGALGTVGVLLAAALLG
ncbi:hypothetical protein JCM9279_000876 [Rhodotorula babjevae]